MFEAQFEARLLEKLDPDIFFYSIYAGSFIVQCYQNVSISYENKYIY